MLEDDIGSNNMYLYCRLILVVKICYLMLFWYLFVPLEIIILVQLKIKNGETDVRPHVLNLKVIEYFSIY